MIITTPEVDFACNRIVWTREQLTQLEQRLVQKRRYAEIAHEFGVTVSSIGHAKARYLKHLCHQKRGKHQIPFDDSRSDTHPDYSGSKIVWLAGIRAQNLFAIVDEEDYERVMDYCWHSIKGYAAGKINNKQVLLHNFIMGRREGLELDHINRNKLDNRKINLRYATRVQQLANVSYTRGKSRFKGVSVFGNRWRAVIKANGVYRHLGLFSTEVEAAIAYNSAAQSMSGEFAYLNEV